MLRDHKDAEVARAYYVPPKPSIVPEYRPLKTHPMMRRCARCQEIANKATVERGAKKRAAKLKREKIAPKV